MILLFPTFDPGHLETQIELKKKKKKGSFLFYFRNVCLERGGGVEFKHLSSILLAKATNINALVRKFETWNIWLENRPPESWQYQHIVISNDGLRHVSAL